jgi:hypothetical protein
MKLHWCPVSQFNAHAITAGLKLGGGWTYRAKSARVIELIEQLGLDLSAGERPTPQQIIDVITPYGS